MNKTGTSTLKHCFVELRLLPIASPSSANFMARGLFNEILEKENYEPALSAASDYKAFEDRPWNVWEMYKHLDQRYPDSKFILTEREPELWWKSVNQWITISNPDRAKTYVKHLKASSVSKQEFIRGYLEYNEGVKEYFKDSGKLLTFNVEKGQGWEELCDFLKLPLPKVAFPHANRQTYSRLDHYAKKRTKYERQGRICQNCDSLITKKKKNYSGIQSRLIPLKELLIQRVSSSKIRQYKDQYDIIKRGSRGMRVRNIKKRNPSMTLDDFAVVTCFYNPGRFNSRVSNFKKFLENIKVAGVSILVVEFIRRVFNLSKFGVKM